MIKQTLNLQQNERHHLQKTSTFVELNETQTVNKGQKRDFTLSKNKDK